MWLLGVGCGSFFSDQSRWTVMAEHASGSPALTGEMAATAPRRKSRRPARDRAAQILTDAASLIVSGTIIEASLQALVDSLEYALLKK